MFTNFPYADVYSHRINHSTPGKIIVRGNGKDKRCIIAMLGQFYPGKIKYPSSKKDGLQARLTYFESCLEQMKHLQGSFAFPWRIGCGDAGGDWEKYLSAIKNFSEKNSKKVVIYRLTPEKQPETPKLF